jgi:hypothetical protein
MNCAIAVTLPAQSARPLTGMYPVTQPLLAVRLLSAAANCRHRQEWLCYSLFFTMKATSAFTPTRPLEKSWEAMTYSSRS